MGPRLEILERFGAIEVAVDEIARSAVSLLAGAITFYWHPVIDRLRSPVLVFDGAGLALFAVSGPQEGSGVSLSVGNGWIRLEVQA
jgi:uncharacterized membrane protein YeiH